MNKYEIRAEAVLRKKEEYLRNREKKIHRTATIIASVACVGAVIAVAAMFKSIFRPIDVSPTNPTSATNVTVDMTVALGYEGKKIFIDTESKNYGEFKTCYVNDNNVEDVYNGSNKYGVIDKNGNVVVPPVYNKAYAVSENCFVVEKRNENHDVVSALTDSDGNILFDFYRGYIRKIPYGKDVYVLIAENYNGKDILIKTDGTRAIDIDFESLVYAHTAGAPEGYETDELLLGIYNNEIYVINYKGEITGVYGEKPEIKKALGNGFNLTAAFRSYQGNYKTLLLGVCDNEGKEIIPCEYISLYFTGDRFVGRRGENQGLNPDDVAVIYDTQGNIVCESGRFVVISIDYGAETGIGIAFAWDEDAMMSLGGEWVIDKNGNKLSDAYDRIEKNSDGTYTGYYDRQSKTHLLDANGKIIE